MDFSILASLSAVWLTLVTALNSLASDVRTDISDCARIEIGGSRKHPALNGFYDKTADVYNGLPTFEGTNNGKTRHIWWNPQKQFTRWSIGIDKYSNSIEAFMDNRVQQAWLLGQGRSWHVVHEGDWVIDEDMFVLCTQTEQNNLQAPDLGRLNPDIIDQIVNNQGAAGGNGGSAPPMPGMNNNNNNNNNINNNVGGNAVRQFIQVRGSSNAINGKFYKSGQQYDGFDVYQSEDQKTYMYHYTYDSFKRWYIGNELGSDTNVYAFIYANKNDLVVDSSDQIWTEHISNTNQWSQNPNIKLLLKQEPIQQQQQQPPPIQNNNERRPPMPGGGNNNNINNNINNANNNQNQNQNQNNMDSENMVPPGQTDNNINQRNQRNQRAQQYQNRQANRQQRERENAQEKEKRKKDMFRKVNNIDRMVSSASNMESGVSVTNEPSVVIVGSELEPMNAIYTIQPLKYNNHHVYKNAIGCYLYYVFYEDIDTGRWQIGRPNSGMQNDQPVAFVNSNSDKPHEVPTWQAWLVFDFEEKEWMRQVNVNTYNSECVVTISGAWREEYNGNYEITPQTYSDRPVFEKLVQKNDQTYRLVVYMDEKQSPFPRWYVSQLDANIGDIERVGALIQSSALTVDGASDYEVWQELSATDGTWNENGEMKVTGTCSKVKEHDWKTKRQRRREEKKRQRAAREAQRKNQCPSDMTVDNDPGQAYATVHWNPVSVESAPGSEEDYDAVFDDESLAPGSQFSLGRTNVVYSVRRKSDNVVIANCDFIINVRDAEPPVFDECPGDVYVMTSFNSNEGRIRWSPPDASDNSGEKYEGDMEIEKISGPSPGETKPVGRYEIKYKATDYFGNSAICKFNVIVADRQAPKIIGCPKDSTIEVYEENAFAAYPEWDAPRGTDNVDPRVDVQQLRGPASGSKISIPPGESETTVTVMYEATDSSDNGARCQFDIKLVKGANTGSQHNEFHDHLSTRMPIGQDNAEVEKHTNSNNEYDLEDSEDKQDEKWTAKARRLREERENKKNLKQKRKERRRNRRRGHRSKIHDAKVDEDETVQDAINEIREETEQNIDDIIDLDKKNAGSEDEDDDTKGRRGRRNRRKKKKRDRKKGDWSGFKNFFWTLIRPWAWPIWLIIPLSILCTSGCCVGLYFVYEDLSRPKGVRVPRRNASLWYRISNHPMFGGKTQKHRI